MEKGENSSSSSFCSTPSSPPITSPSSSSSSLDEGDVAAMVPLGTPEDAPNTPERRQQLLEESSSDSVLTNDLQEKIVRQVEYYFSDENLARDRFLVDLIKIGNQGFVSIGLIASFRKMKKLVQNISLIVAALTTSSQLVVDKDGKLVRRVDPLPAMSLNSLPNKQKNEVKPNTVLVKNLPEDKTLDDIRRIFGNIGNVKDISVQDLNGKVKKINGGPIGHKMHVLIEYDTISEANDAVSKLNDETNWRSGMRVELVKNKKKPGNQQSGFKSTSEGPMSVQTSSNNVCERSSGMKSATGPPNELADSETPPSAKRKNKKKNRNKQKHNVGGEKKQQQQEKLHSTEIGSRSWRKSVSISRNDSLKTSANNIPRMPDGTRGFSMGRGKPLV